jgi:ribose transport system substrate-binding protein
MSETNSLNFSRRDFLKAAGAGVTLASIGALGVNSAFAQDTGQQSGPYRMSFIQFQPHSVPEAWSRGIAEVLSVQGNIEYELLDGQADVNTQISLMDTLIAQNVNAIFLQPVDSVAVGPSIRQARDAGIPVITLNIDAVEPHALHVEMNHYFGAIAIGQAMGELMGGSGKVAILNAPPGIIIRDQRTNGFLEGLAQYPDIEVVSDQNAEWRRDRAQEVLRAILAANPDIKGVYGVNDSMALGAVDVLKDEGLLGEVVVFGNDGEVAALESIEAGELTGTQYTDVFQQGRFAASVAVAMATAGIRADAFGQQGRILMPYFILTQDNVGIIQPNQRW